MTTKAGNGEGIIGREIMNTVKIDLDHHKIKTSEFIARLDFFLSHLPILKNPLCYKTKHGHHIYMEVIGTPDIKDILLIQSLLGDDPNRAILNYKRLKLTGDPQNVLFCRKFDHNGNEISSEIHDKNLEDILRLIIEKNRERL